jgi:fructuronate reductase
VTRLSARALAARPPSGVTLPPPRDLAAGIGILHLGIGAFHRAHQAVFTEDAAVLAGEAGWGICGVTQRSNAVVDQLRPQDGLYAVLERGPGAPALRVVGQVREVLFAAQEQSRLMERFAEPTVRVVTLTVTEKGYRRNATGALDLTDPVVASDLAGSALVASDLAGSDLAGSALAGSALVPSARSSVGQLVRGLQSRHRTSGAPMSVLSCDNLTHNGRVLRGLVHDFCAALPPAEGDPLAEWIEANVSFPSSMVDRIVPATTADDRAEAQDLLGLSDEALVVAEPFRQWVIEDDFRAGRPAWDQVGADLVDDVAPFEQLKLRTLNGAHSMLAYLGALRGYESIAQAVADPELQHAVRQLIAVDVTPTLVQPPGLDVAAYGEQVLERFANPALRHRTVQVAMDGSQKLPLRLLGTIRDRLAQGETPHWAALAVAGWMVFVATGRDRTGRALPLDDPLAALLREAVGGADTATGIVDALLGVEPVFGPDLRESGDLRSALVESASELLAQQRTGSVAS